MHNQKIVRNWKEVQDENHEREFINRHSGHMIGYYELDEAEAGSTWHRDSVEGNIKIDTPHGYQPVYFQTREQAMKWIKNFMREHPAGGAALEETLNGIEAQSPLEHEENRERKQRVFQKFNEAEA